MRASTPFTSTAALGLLAIGGLHVAWGLGSSFPMADRDELADAVVGTDEVPGPLACFAVAGALLTAAAAVSGLPEGRPGLRRLAVGGTVVVLSSRGVLGLLGRTDIVSPGSSSTRFRALDRQVYSPLCLALAGLAAPALVRR